MNEKLTKYTSSSKLWRIGDKLKNIVSCILTFLLVLQTTFGVFLLTPQQQVGAANFTFNQTDWQGGSTSNTHNHTDEQANPGAWTQASTTSANIKISTAGQITLNPASGSATETSDTDFNAGTTATTTVSGSGASASVQLSSVGNQVGWWHMNTNSSSDTTTADSSGNGNTGTLNAGSSGDNTTTSQMWDTGGKLGSETYTGIEFDGTDDYVDVGDPTDGSFDVGTGDFSIVCWFTRYSSAVTNERIIYKGGMNNTDTGYSMWVSDASIVPGLSNGTTRIYPSAITHSGVNNWSHVVVVIDRTAGTMDTYMNGSYVNSADISSFSGDDISNALDVRIGSADDRLYFTGVVDEVSFYDTALSTDEVSALHNSGNGCETCYYASGDFTSQNIDLGQNSDLTTISWGETLPSGTDVQFQLRSAATEAGLSTATWYGPTGTGDYYTTNTGENINSIHDGDRWIQYKAFLTTTDSANTPSFNDITINYQYYPTASSYNLDSSAYNTENSANVISSIDWTENLPTGTDIEFQLRTAPDSSGSPGTWSDWLGPTSTSDFYTDPTGEETINSTHTDGIDDQWVQYRALLSTTDSSVTPTLSNFNLNYSYNATPVASASNITGADDPVYAGVEYSLTAVYSDGDGYADLADVYLKIDHDTATDIEMHFTEAGATGSGSVTVDAGADYLIGTPTYSYTTSGNNLTATWTFKLDWDWTESTLIEYAVKAIDAQSADSGYDSTNIDVLYENDLTFSGTLAASGSVQGGLNSGDWVQGGESISWSGLSVVYEGSAVNPADADFDIRITDDDTGSWDQLTGSTLATTTTADSATDIEDIHNIDIINT
jgi:hypothetical protein